MCLSGWIFDLTLLKSISPGLISIKVNTAIVFIIEGVLLLLSLEQLKPSGIKNIKFAFWFLLSLVVLISSLSLFEYLLGKNFGIDQFLFRNLDKNTLFPGRMAPNTAVLFLLSSLSILLLSPSWQSDRNPVIAAVISLVLVIACLFSIADYPEPGMGNVLGNFNPMAYPTAFAFIILSMGIFALSMNSSNISWSLKRGITIGFIIGLALIIGMSLFSNSSTMSLRKSYISVVHTDDVRFHINELQSDLEDVELNRQNYLLFGNAK